MDRRQFFQPGSLVQTVETVFEDAVPPPEEAAHVRFARRAMATQFEVIFPFGTPMCHVWGDLALNEIDRVEDLLTVYRDSSELSRLNQRAWRHPVVVSPELFHVLSRCHGYWERTEGASDIALGALIKTWGFFKRQGRVPTDAELAEVVNRVGMKHVVFDAQRWTIFFERNGLEINLGSVGKGYALDRAAQMLRREWGTEHVLLHGGHSSVFAWGNEAPGLNGWRLGITHPDNPERRIGYLHLKNRGMATSAATHQHFEHEGRKLGHLLDPRTLWPAEGMRLATVTAPTAEEADALATAFFILGVEKTAKFCEQNPHLGALLLPQGANAKLQILGVAREEFTFER